jgi:hypothetical protein
VNLLYVRFNPASMRAMLALAVVFVILATTGWTAVRPHVAADPRAASLSAWMKNTIGTHKLPDPNAAPAAIARFFASITHAQQVTLADQYPLVVGNLNGAPLTLRYLANRQAINEAQVAAAALYRSDRLTTVGRHDVGRLMNRYASLLSGHRQILAFDPTGTGRAAEVLGNLSTATRVSVVVPGVDTDLLNFERTSKAYTSPVGMARALYGAEQAASPGAHSAVIAWADYTSPTGVGLDASIGADAEFGAVRLEALLTALPQHAQVALFCHSYGSVLCGVAAPDLPQGRVSDITVFGSPGMRAQHVSSLHTTAHVWAARDSGDWISGVPHLEFAGLGHGADPVSRGFGARVISAAGAVGHPGYFAPNTTSLANFAQIGLGSYSRVVCNPGNACTTGLA